MNVRSVGRGIPRRFTASGGVYPALLALLLVGGIACDRKGGGQKTVVVYTSVDEPVATPILNEFEKKTGIKVVVQKDTEATRTAGLAERLIAERDNPRADVWWGNEASHTVDLAERDVLAPYKSKAHDAIPPNYRDSKGRWAGTALRARVIARSVNCPIPITSIKDLTRPELKGRVCMARPTAGTTGGHVAALYALWGKQDADEFFRKLKENDIKLVGGNSIVAEQVGKGSMWAGLTDNDDVDAILREGGKLEMILPDQSEGSFGTMAIPCTVGLVKGAKNESAAKELVDYLLSKEVEQKLLDAKFARYSVFAKEGTLQLRPMRVELAAVAGNHREAVQSALKILEGR
jgi:iron(III) transport system substrate-binding protein